MRLPLSLLPTALSPLGAPTLCRRLLGQTLRSSSVPAAPRRSSAPAAARSPRCGMASDAGEAGAAPPPPPPPPLRAPLQAVGIVPRRHGPRHRRVDAVRDALARLPPRQIHRRDRAGARLGLRVAAVGGPPPTDGKPTVNAVVIFARLFTSAAGPHGGTPPAEGDTLLVRQFRPSVGRDSVEFPAGLVDGGETPTDAAMRELREETGFTATAVVDVSPVTYTSTGLSDEGVVLVTVDVDEADARNGGGGGGRSCSSRMRGS
ncbi:hypothetical protein BU14_0072s0039 [Porphyra umbilicalis]|uniref:Nudix hydrolase domain-containing protein n=1 Tax=Porphyra umbilicalis TaxID=2786 RepID=A0A1X6PFQ5_PORUM|nr:hypothetical protein BU14_0072s0039 [Porphyra umbilicalis]|eukprot:OSX79681.1 hypothetical protein BU14_0072s0039 [Porphyra umbilicalis]